MWRRLPNANAKNNRCYWHRRSQIDAWVQLPALALLALAAGILVASSAPASGQISASESNPSFGDNAPSSSPLSTNTPLASAPSIDAPANAGFSPPAAARTAGSPAQTSASSSSDSKDESQSDVAFAILFRCLHESVYAKQPAQSDVRQTISIAGKKSVGVGHYLRGGKRLGLLRYSLQFSSREQLNSLLQVGDGQRLLTMEEIHGIRRYSEVDLSQVRSRLAQNGLNNRTIYNKVDLLHRAIGGQSEVLRSLCQKFTWHSVSETTAEGQPAWRLLGTLALEPQAVRGLAPVDEQMFGNSHSTLIPTNVEAVVATNDAAFPFWLHRVSYSRASTEIEGVDEAMQATTEWHNPKLLQEVDPQVFLTPGAGGHEFEDETHMYLPPLNLAATPPESLSR